MSSSDQPGTDPRRPIGERAAAHRPRMPGQRRAAAMAARSSSDASTGRPANTVHVWMPVALRALVELLGDLHRAYRAAGTATRARRRRVRSLVPHAVERGLGGRLPVVGDGDELHEGLERSGSGRSRGSERTQASRSATAVAVKWVSAVVRRPRPRSRSGRGHRRGERRRPGRREHHRRRGSAGDGSAPARPSRRTDVGSRPWSPCRRRAAIGARPREASRRSIRSAGGGTRWPIASCSASA